MYVSEWMTVNPGTVSSDTPIMDAMQQLREGGFRSLPVLDDGVLVGIVTDRDLKNASASSATALSVYELNYLLSKLTVQQVMTRSVLSVSPDDPIEKAATIMEEHKISGLPVLTNGELVGILTVSDLLEAFVDILSLREGGTLGAVART